MDAYGFAVLNRRAFELLVSMKRPPRGDIDSADRDYNRVLMEAGRRGWLSDDGYFAGRVVDNGNSVPFMSAPIRVWLEVTSRCSLKCEQCFNESHPAYFQPDLPLESILQILDELHNAGVLQLTITGGEPLIRRDIYSILDRAVDLGFGLRFFTNGVALTDEHAKRLSEYPISHLFLSLDGIGHLNDVLRGSRTYRRITRGLSVLAPQNSNITLSTTLHRLSLSGIDELFEMAGGHGVRSILIRPLFQYRNLENDLSIPASEIDSFLSALEAASVRHGVEYQVNKLPFRPLHKEVYRFDNPEDVHFSHFTTHNRFGCVGGNTVVGIKANGVIMACGFLPHSYAVEGNSVLENRFVDLWNRSGNVTVLRDVTGNPTCNSCSLLAVCGGGCRASALLRNGDINSVDPYCYWAGKADTKPQADFAPVQYSLDPVPFISERLVVTKCGSGTNL